MSQKQSETSSCYMDGIRVKISERYKPPPKITQAMTYAHRLTLNRQLQDHLPEYDFELNANVKQKMREWRIARTNMAMQRKATLERIEIEENLKKKEIQAIAAQSECNKSSMVNESENSLLIPTQSNILTPIPLAPQKYVQTIDDASPINISDFDPDTSSPFDNLELKTINDIEELKLVLQNDDKRKFQLKIDENIYALPNNQTCEPSQNSYFSMSTPLSTSIPTQVHQYEPNNTQYSSAATSTDTNGYTPYYGNSTDLYAYYNGTDYNSVNYARNVNNSGTSCTANSQSLNTIPDILKALQNQLNLNVQQEQNAPESALAAAADACNHTENTKVTDNHLRGEDDKLENPYHAMSKSAQNICDSIATMGFPLPRVARVCKSIGEDEKKIVDFLLCQSQLMDLGFSEEKVATALHESHNNRDKALELLIS